MTKNIFKQTLSPDEEIQLLKAKVAALENQLASQATNNEKLMAQVVKQSNQELDENTQALEKAQQQLVQTAKRASIGQFTAGLAHELNQPLGRIFLTSELVQSMIQSDRPLETQRISNLLQRILKDVESAKSLMNHLRMYSHLDVNSTMTSIDLKQIINDSLILFTHQMKVLKIDFSLTFKHHNQLEGDMVQIEQVINNLMSNAIDALNNSEKPQLSLTTFEQGNYTCVAIKDSGCGMTQMLIESIFDPFFTTKQSGEGTGLGLSISKGIIDNHRGQITVVSKPKEGSCVTIFLPNRQVTER